MTYNKVFTTIILSIIICSFANAQINKHSYNQTNKEDFINNKIKSMSLEEKIGQIIIIGSDTKNDPAYVSKISKAIDSLKLGGVCFFKGTNNILLELNKTYSSIAKTPLLYSIDGEWGLAMRLTDAFSYPRQLTLGASNNDSLIYEMGKNIALQSKTMGIHINFAPDVDINLNPKNPVIGNRSFGEDKERVARLGWAYLKGMEDNGVYGSVKHFPGHGDTETDSHLALPTINHTKAYIDSVDSYPFRYAIDRGARMVMIGHLNIPCLISDPKLPSSLSKEVITDYLKRDLNFKGIVITDALTMNGVTNNFVDGEAEVRALIAGVDILLMPKDEYKAVSAIKKAIKDGRITEKEIEDKCKKVLDLKYDLGLFDNNTQEISIPSEKLINQAQEISDKLSESIITLTKNTDNNLPIIEKEKARIAIVQLGNDDIKDFTSKINEYNEAKVFQIKEGDSIQKLAEELSQVDYVITVICGDVTKKAKDNYGISKSTINKLAFLQEDYNVILALFANPYSLNSIDSFECINSILVGYQNMPCLQKAMAKTIFGLINVEGKLPVTSSNKYKVNYGLNFDNDMMYWIKYAQAGMNPEYLKKIDSIANEGIRIKAYPGCQIVVLHDNKLAYSKSYGYQTYDSIIPVNENTIYDVASVTKIMATTISMMKLYEEHKYDLDDKLSDYLPYLKHTNKKKITIKQVLSHNAGLKAWLPFYKESMEDGKLNPSIYSNNPIDKNNYYKVCDNLYIKKTYRDEILKKIAKSDLNKKPGYVYSDFGFILLGDMIEKITNMPLNEYVSKTFYSPMKLNHTSFKPSEKFSIDSIAPTENDNYFRNELIKGYVHDPASSMMGGVAGHAGLFSNALDLSEICQMLINGGEINGKKYLNAETINIFNHKYFENNRRGLGFDKPVDNPKTNSSPCSKYAPEDSYGHTGFTGTFFWVDPIENLVIVFLSNRVYPTAENTKLSKYDIRTNIHDLIYESIINSKK